MKDISFLPNFAQGTLRLVILGSQLDSDTTTTPSKSNPNLTSSTAVGLHACLHFACWRAPGAVKVKGQGTSEVRRKTGVLRVKRIGQCFSPKVPANGPYRR